ncbi:hypothetical protein [Amycolatopsis sp. La24]|uniref:hypothetical protein n=1 Tax=Amycolatopsis sp. La24 TaxID=3028304 RepID=UPI0023AFF7F6|nr:hypothetical protein [Amycolatopsis sp. La24]
MLNRPHRTLFSFGTKAGGGPEPGSLARAHCSAAADRIGRALFSFDNRAGGRLEPGSLDGSNGGGRAQFSVTARRRTLEISSLAASESGFLRCQPRTPPSGRAACAFPGLARAAAAPCVTPDGLAARSLAGPIRARAAPGTGPVAKVDHLGGTGRGARNLAGFGFGARRNTILSGGVYPLRASPRTARRAAPPGFPPGGDRPVRRGAALDRADGRDGPKRADQPAICQDRHSGTSS